MSTSAFNPLGEFNPLAPIDTLVLAQAKVLQVQLPDAPKGDISRIYLHWSVAKPCVDFPDYNVMVTIKDGHHELDITHDPRDNALSTFKPSYATHTYHRNKGAVGICLAGMDGATEQDYGPDPVTVAGLTYLCAAAAVVALKYGIDLSQFSEPGPVGAYANETVILTHAEAANRPGEPLQYENYFVSGERWDLGSFTAVPSGHTLTVVDITACGNALRKMAHNYKVALE